MVEETNIKQSHL